MHTYTNVYTYPIGTVQISEFAADAIPLALKLIEIIALRIRSATCHKPPTNFIYICRQTLVLALSLAVVVGTHVL